MALAQKKILLLTPYTTLLLDAGSLYLDLKIHVH